MLSYLVNDLLDLAKMESDSFQFNYEYFNLQTTIDKVFNQIRYMANKKKITLKSLYKNIHAIQIRDEYTPPITKVHNPEVYRVNDKGGIKDYQPDQLLDLTKELTLLENIYGDPRRYLQIMMNFVSNSLKFTSENGQIIIKVSLMEVQDKKKKKKTAKTLQRKGSVGIKFKSTKTITSAQAEGFETIELDQSYRERTNNFSSKIP